jgi:RNA 3'-terminal phosphate cyclase (ATP)
VLGRGQAIGPGGGAIVVWAETENAVLGAGRVAERGVPAEVLGEGAAAELREDLFAHAVLDVHAADQIQVCLALARGESAFTARSHSSHAVTAIWLLEQLLPMRFSTETLGSLVRVNAAPRAAA